MWWLMGVKRPGAGLTKRTYMVCVWAVRCCFSGEVKSSATELDCWRTTAAFWLYKSIDY